MCINVDARSMFLFGANTIVFLSSLSSFSLPSMEKPSPSAPYHSLALTEAIVLLFFNTISIWFLLLQKLSLSFLSCSPSPSPCASRVNHADKGDSPAEARDDQAPLELTREEVEAVMEIMGFASRGPDAGDPLDERVELRRLFDDSEPNLDEVEAAFKVFDENNDGFIDATELQRVLPNLGFREGLALDACQQMIAAYDENQDGRIDFDEFVKFMEKSFR